MSKESQKNVNDMIKVLDDQSLKIGTLKRTKMPGFAKLRFSSPIMNTWGLYALKFELLDSSDCNTLVLVLLDTGGSAVYSIDEIQGQSACNCYTWLNNILSNFDACIHRNHTYKAPQCLSWSCSQRYSFIVHSSRKVSVTCLICLTHNIS